MVQLLRIKVFLKSYQATSAQNIQKIYKTLQSVNLRFLKMFTHSNSYTIVELLRIEQFSSVKKVMKVISINFPVNSKLSIKRFPQRFSLETKRILANTRKQSRRLNA